MKQDGSPDRGYNEAKAAAEELTTVDVDHVDASVALLHDYDNWWAIGVQPHAPEFDYWEHLRCYYRVLRARGVQVDVVHPDAPLDDYEAVVAPGLHLVDTELADHLTQFVEQGGQLLVGARSGVKTPANQLHETLAPGPLADLTGLVVDQHESYPEDVPLAVEVDGDEYAATIWAEWLDPDPQTTVVATHTSGPGAGRPAVTRRNRGDGSVTYCGVWPGSELLDELVAELLSRGGIKHTSRLPDGVRFNERDGLTWVTNFTSRQFELDVPMGAVVSGGQTLGAFDVAVVSTAPHLISISNEAS
ncbi:beta-galactosidase [Haloferax sp. ATB1]